MLICIAGSTDFTLLDFVAGFIGCIWIDLVDQQILASHKVDWQFLSSHIDISWAVHSCLLVSSWSSYTTHWLTLWFCVVNTVWDCSLLEHTFWLGFDTNIFCGDLFFLGWSALLDIKLALEGINFKLLHSCIKLNSRMVSQHNTTLHSWLVTWNVTSFKHWVSGCTTSNVQDPITLLLLVVHVPICNLLLG